MSKWIISLFFVLNLSAQMDISSFLQGVANENLSIKAAYLNYDKHASTYYTNVLPDRPELTFERSEISTGSSLSTANEKNVALTQTFQFPLTYFYKRKTANLDIKIAYQTYLESALKVIKNAKNEASTYIVLKKKQALINEFLKRYSILLKQMEFLKVAGETSEMNLLRISLEYEQLLNEQKRFESDVFAQKEVLKAFLPGFHEGLIDSIFISENLKKINIEKELTNNLPFLKRSELELNRSEFNKTK